MAVSEDENRSASVSQHDALARVFPAEAASVRRARETVAELAQAHAAAPDRVDDIRLAVSEAATNVVMHAYQEHESGAHFRLLALVGGAELLVIIDDEGCGLSSPARTPGLGMGLKLMRELAEQALFLTRDHGGSAVQLRFRLR
ncbi:MAG TPA: ATP-binding protein [Solirubrobacteraceae bacterium]|nr:ATP-binding protein [Solirubrobacteraceae bacterium]